MSNAPTRVHAIENLTRAQKKVLADLELFSKDGEHVAIASRKLAEATGLCRATVMAAIDRLNELQLIRTRPGRTPSASEHTLLFRGSVRTGHGLVGPSGKASSTGGAR